VLAPLVAALPLVPGTPLSLPVFSMQARSVHVITVTVDSLQTVTVPAGTFKVYRVRGTGGDSGLVWYVTSDAPRRIVKTEIVGTPVVFELVK